MIFAVFDVSYTYRLGPIFSFITANIRFNLSYLDYLGPMQFIGIFTLFHTVQNVWLMRDHPECNN